MNSSKENTTKRLVLAALFCVLVFVGTMISVPAPSVGNINLGDCMLILCACFLGDGYAVIAGALGATLSDLLSGYVIYAPGTAVIKALMVVLILLFRRFVLKKDNFFALLVPALLAECFMVIGYFLYESLVLHYGWGAILNAPFNAIQAVANLIVAILLWKLLKKYPVFQRFLD